MEGVLWWNDVHGALRAWEERNYKREAMLDEALQYIYIMYTTQHKCVIDRED